MPCSDCENKEKDCGCTEGGISINDVCNPIDCPADECAESFAAQCILYTGDPIICNDVTIIENGTNVAQALANISAFFCTQDGVDADIVCGEDTVVTAETSINDALDQIVAYFCQRLSDLEATVSSNTTALLNTTQVGTTCVANPTTGCDECTTTITFRDNGNNIIDQVQFSYTQCPGPNVNKQVITGINPAALGASVNVPHTLGTQDFVINVYTELAGNITKVDDNSVLVQAVTATDFDIQSLTNFVVGTTLRVVLIG